MARPLFRFLRSERGAVTVDWVVLTAAVAGLGITTILGVQTGVINLGGEVNSALSGVAVASLTGEDVSSGGYTPFIATQDDIANWVQEYTDNFSDDELRSLYAELSMGAANALDAGNPAGSEIYFDLMSAANTALRNRGLDIPDGSSSFDDLMARYDAAVT
ncbi:hypothetical protein [Pararhodobacter sp.]|uniref:Flp family type IVb pilin n=1 Tax=Pararhodobacter sp. TaxID=2127056 RepID=UPI002AFE3BFE|nr:hypothetical protein [Pararhodobacter sp.]